MLGLLLGALILHPQLDQFFLERLQLLMVIGDGAFLAALLLGQFLVELVWWIETLDGQIWEEGGATVRLPSRRSN